MRDPISIEWGGQRSDGTDPVGIRVEAAEVTIGEQALKHTYLQPPKGKPYADGEYVSAICATAAVAMAAVARMNTRQQHRHASNRMAKQVDWVLHIPSRVERRVLPPKARMSAGS